jgi:hypothetical protein
VSDQPTTDAAPGEAAQHGPRITFYRLIPGARLPQRADRSAAGSLPTRAFRYCEPVVTASAFGYYVFPPINFTVLWDGHEISWTYQGSTDWLPLTHAQFPYFASHFDERVPEEVRGFSPPFLSALQEPGLIQLWCGLVARTAPGWSLLVRPCANLPRGGAYEVQPLPREALDDAALNNFEVVPDLESMTAEDWDDFHATVVRPMVMANRPRGEYATATRKRRKTEESGE